VTWLRLVPNADNWRVASRLILLVAIPAVLGLTLAGLTVASSLGSAHAYAQVSRNAVLAQQVTGLAQALENEQATGALFIANGRPPSGLPALGRQYAATGAWAGRVRRLAAQLDRGQPPARTRASVTSALRSIAALPALRRETARGPATPLQVSNGYAAAITGLFPVVDGIADLSSNATLITSVRALGSLARLTGQVAQQQAVLGSALAAGRLEPAALTALAVAQSQEGTDAAAFQGSATTEEGWALARTLAAPQARQATAVEQRATASGAGPLALGPQASGQWQAGTSYTLGWLRHAGQQLARWITADAQAQQRSATRFALLIGAAAVAGLLLTVLLALLIVRSVVRPLRRLEAAALDAAASGLPALAPLAAPLDVAAGGEIGEVARAFGRLHAEAVRMAGEEARLRDSVGVVVASFFRRSHPLYDRLLELVDNMELGEEDHERLARLFEIDNLATRMRRHSDTALVLAGHQTPRRWTQPVPLVDVLRAAASEIEHYDQVSIDVQSDVQVSDEAAVDIVHLLAELLENAISFSTDSDPVSVSGFLDAGGEALIDITDSGPGLADDFLGWLNWQLAHPEPADPAVARQLGLFAVAHLAARHGISVVLTHAPGGGTTAQVRLPPEMVRTGALPWNGASRLEATSNSINKAAAVAADPRQPAPQLTAAPIAEPDDAADMPEPEPERAAPTGPLPIFDSIRSELPRRVPPPGPPGPPAHQRLASFQQGSRRARATAQLERETDEPAAEQSADGD
jgi:signal transduction histidine kinase